MIAKIPKYQVITYVHIVVNHQPHKEEENCVQITSGGNLIKYLEELTIHTDDLITTKILWNSVLSTPKAKYTTVDIENMYLATSLDRY